MASPHPLPRTAFRDPFHTPSAPQIPRRHVPKQRFIADISQCLFEFVIQLLPTPEEIAVKEDVRKLLERLIRTIEPDSRLLSFGSTANGFSLKNSGNSTVQLLIFQLTIPIASSQIWTSVV